MSYLDTEESTPEAMLANELVLAESDLTRPLIIYNNLDRLFEEVRQGNCDFEATCAATFVLCFLEESVIVECDSEKRATDRIWTPRRKDLVNEDLNLSGKAWHWRPNSSSVPCYIASIKVQRIDGTQDLLQNPFVTKRIFVKNTGEPPFITEMVNRLYA